MGTVFRIGCLRVIMYTHDHWPPHVHVKRPDGEARIALGRAAPVPHVLDNEGLTNKQLAAVLLEIERRRDQLKQMWREIHGIA